MSIKQTAQRLVAEIDEEEVAVIIAESCCGMTRPDGQTASEALASIKEFSPTSHHDFTKAARRVMLYLKNQIDRGNVAS